MRRSLEFVRRGKIRQVYCVHLRTRYSVNPCFPSTLPICELNRGNTSRSTSSTSTLKALGSVRRTFCSRDLMRGRTHGPFNMTTAHSPRRCGPVLNPRPAGWLHGSTATKSTGACYPMTPSWRSWTEQTTWVASRNRTLPSYVGEMMDH